MEIGFLSDGLVPNKGEVSCECSGENGLTFANSFYVAPNTIDFSTVFLKFSPKDQAAVLAIFILVIVLYVILMIWGRHQDKKDIVKWGVTPLIDNFVDDTYYYLITVYTGMRRGAGTRSRVGFIVAGEDDDTGVRELYDGVRTEFSTASVNHFLMATSQPLGPLTYLYIFHDNSGEGEWSSWYLNRVDIEDLQDRTRFVFLCGRWLSLDSLDCQVETVLPVCGRENVTTFKNMFFINYKENLADNHLWVSIYFRPTSSHFTRIQRITCLLLFIMLTMIGNAVYFRPEDEYEIQLW
uniref:PLAT domain-containing protein n=1 Tax=Magallana gigas TaxID=29159 RepID=A0A8W8K4X6_MAGGI